MFGGIPPLLHVHDIHVKDRAELHLGRLNSSRKKKEEEKGYKRSPPMET